MNLGLITVHHNDPDNFIDDPEYFFQYYIWVLCVHEVKKIQTIPTHIRNSQLQGGSNSHMFNYITMSTYIRHVKCNLQILNVRKSPTKVFGLVIIKNPKTGIIVPLWPS